MKITKIVTTEFIAKGAEATIHRGSFLEIPIIIKQRDPKRYRMPQIDKEIRLHRLRAEARILSLAWRLNIRVPAVLAIDTQKQALLIEELQGVPLYEFLTQSTVLELVPIFKEIGRTVAELHKNDIIHGDLTVFNIIIDKFHHPWLIDFGLAHISIETEKQADDVLLFENTLKAITSSHQKLLRHFQDVYVETFDKGQIIFEQAKKIQSRGRYIAREDRLE